MTEPTVRIIGPTAASDRTKTHCAHCIMDLTIHFGSMRVTLRDHFARETYTSDLYWASPDYESWSILVWLCPHPTCRQPGAINAYT